MNKLLCYSFHPNCFFSFIDTGQWHQGIWQKCKAPPRTTLLANHYGYIVYSLLIFYIRPHSLYCLVDKLRQGSFVHCRRKKIKIKINILPLVGGKNKKKVGKLFLQVKISKFHKTTFYTTFPLTSSENVSQWPLTSEVQGWSKQVTDAAENVR